ncbi:hypothetical protein L9F63_020409, partial [Diploptera punctata]
LTFFYLMLPETISSKIQCTSAHKRADHEYEKVKVVVKSDPTRGLMEPLMQKE